MSCRYRRRKGPKKVKDPVKYKLNNAIVNISRRCNVSRDEVRKYLIPIFAALGEREESDRLHCPYCDVELALSNISFDHAMPLSRGGDPWVPNIVPCCLVCNKAKGALTAFEFTELMITMAEWPQVAKDNVTRRLRLGGAMMCRFFRRRRR